MDYRKLGSCGVKVSPICLGTAFRAFMRGRTDEQTCIDVIKCAVDFGVNFIDCANFYSLGGSEEILGKALKELKGKRDDLVLTSKVYSRIGEGPNDRGLSRYHIMREIDRSLRRLQTDRIDIYLLHHFDPDTPLEETLWTMDDLVRQGKIRYIGYCNFTAAQVVEALWTCDRRGLTPPACLQNQYNLLHRREIEPEILPRCWQHGLGMMTFSPLAVGLLTGIYRRGQQPPTDSLWGQDTGRFEKIMTERIEEIVRTLVDIGADHGITPAQVAIAWILDHPEVTSAIIGPDLPEHVEEVCGAVNWHLPDDARQRLDDVSGMELPGKYA